MPNLPPYHGGRAVDLRVDAPRAASLKSASGDWPSWTLTDIQLADLELLATGAYAPLTGFASERDHASVVEGRRLEDGTYWPLPIDLDVDAGTADAAIAAGHLALRDAEGTMLAAMTVTSRWRPDPAAEARRLLGTDDLGVPEAAALRARAGAVRLGGPIEALELPAHHDLAALRATPEQVRARLAGHPAAAVLAVHLRGVPTSPLIERIVRSAKELQALVLLHPTVGPVEAVDLDRFTLARLAAAAADELRRRGVAVELAVTPLPARLAGPREAALHAIVRQNHGATHLLVGPWHGTPHAAETGPPLFGPGAAQRLLETDAGELAIAPVRVPREVLLTSGGRFVPADQVPADAEVTDLAESQLHEAFAAGTEPPADYLPEPLADELRRALPPRCRRGLTIFLTGLSGSGKSTIAKVLRDRLLERGGRTVTLLDGDLVRRNLSSELGFSKEHRDLNVLRIGYVASEITKHGGIAICAPIAPYDEIRKANRARIEATGGGYVLVHVATPLEVCEARDRKGLYARARAGQLRGFTGIDDPYEVPEDAALTIDTTDVEPHEAVEEILDHLEAEGWWPEGATPTTG
jgi:sulfate adenylyltransferase